MMSLVFVTIWDCRTHVPMTSSIKRTDLDFKISVALKYTYHTILAANNKGAVRICHKRTFSHDVAHLFSSLILVTI